MNHLTKVAVQAVYNRIVDDVCPGDNTVPYRPFAAVFEASCRRAEKVLHSNEAHDVSYLGAVAASIIQSLQRFLGVSDEVSSHTLIFTVNVLWDMRQQYDIETVGQGTLRFEPQKLMAA